VHSFFVRPGDFVTKGPPVENPVCLSYEDNGARDVTFLDFFFGNGVDDAEPVFTNFFVKAPAAGSREGE
jgi:hypothetical protein